MTSIAVYNTSTQVEQRDWLASNFGTDEPRSITLDVSTFTAAQHYANGFIPAGTILAPITATPGLFGPYLDAASDGRQVAAGILFSTVSLASPVITTVDVGAAMMEMGIIIAARLPFTSGNAAAGGYLDTAGRADLVNWFKFL